MLDDGAVVRSAALLSVLSSWALLHCGGCEQSTGLSDEGLRLWGRRKLADDVKEQAQAPIDAAALDADDKARRRVLSMRFDEAVARYGYLELSSVATFVLTRNGHRVAVHESTVVQHGLHGSFRVVQKDEDEAVTRESVFNNGVLYIRNGARGKMRLQGIINDQHLAVREEAWAPLKTFTQYYGSRLGLSAAGSSRVGRRRAVRYKLMLLDGPELIEVPGINGKKAPVSLSGYVHVDAETGVPTKVKLRGELRIPGAEGAEPGILKLSLDSSIKPGKDEEIRPGDFVPTIAHRPVDLDPLKFLDTDTRTSTVIGGRP